MTRRKLIGTRWRNANGAVATVERIALHKIVVGRWDNGAPWAEAIDWLPKVYVEVDGGPAEDAPETRDAA